MGRQSAHDLEGGRGHPDRVLHVLGATQADFADGLAVERTANDLGPAGVPEFTTDAEKFFHVVTGSKTRLSEEYEWSEGQPPAAERVPLTL